MLLTVLPLSCEFPAVCPQHVSLAIPLAISIFPLVYELSNNFHPAESVLDTSNPLAIVNFLSIIPYLK